MKAIVVHAHGGPEVLAFEDVDLPAPGAGEVHLVVKAAGVNFMDTGTRRGLASGFTHVPMTPGVEGAGLVKAVGPGVTHVKPGDRVAWYFAWGSYAEELIAPAEQVVPLPDAIDFETGASLMMQGLTASNCVFDAFPVGPGDTALVHAAAGGVGLLLLQMIRILGGRAIGRVSSNAKVALAKEAGASDVIVDASGKFAEEVARLTDGGGVNVVYDGTGGESFDDSLASVAFNGTLALFGPMMQPVAPLNPFSLPRGVKVTAPVVMYHVRSHAALLQRSKQLFDWVQSGQLKLHVGERYPLSEARRAHEDIESRKTMGKLLLIP